MDINELFNIITPICRKCDIIMVYEEENPEGYLLYKCECCNNRIGIQLKKK